MIFMVLSIIALMTNATTASNLDTSAQKQYLPYFTCDFYDGLPPANGHMNLQIYVEYNSLAATAFGASLPAIKQDDVLRIGYKKIPSQPGHIVTDLKYDVTSQTFRGQMILEFSSTISLQIPNPLTQSSLSGAKDKPFPVTFGLTNKNDESLDWSGRCTQIDSND